MAEAIDQRASSAFDQRGQLVEYTRTVLGMQAVGPALRIGEHLLRGKAHDRPDVLAHERAGEIARGMGRVDDRRTDGEQARQGLLGRLQLGVGGKGIRLRFLEPGDVGPGADQFQRLAGVVVEDAKGVLDPDIVPVPMPEPVFDGSSTLFDQKAQLAEHLRGVIRVQPVGPALRISDHLLRGKAHDRLNIFAHECAGVVPRSMGRVNDRWTRCEQVLESLAGANQLGLDRLAPDVVRFKLATPLAQLDHVLLIRPLSAFHGSHPDEDDDDGARPRFPMSDVILNQAACRTSS